MKKIKFVCEGEKNCIVKEVGIEIEVGDEFIPVIGDFFEKGDLDITNGSKNNVVVMALNYLTYLQGYRFHKAIRMDVI